MPAVSRETGRIRPAGGLRIAGMAGGRLNFWGVVTASVVGFLLLVAIIIFAALLVLDLSRSSPQLSDEQVRENTAPVGRILLRSQD